MVLEPFSALTVASTVVAFVDFTSKLISKTHAIHKGVAVEQREVAGASRRLRELSADLQKALHTTAQYAKTAKLSKSEMALAEVASECQRLAEKFEAEVEQLIPVPGQSPWKSFRQAFKSVWSKEELEKTQKSLSAQRELLSIHLLVWMR